MKRRALILGVLACLSWSTVFVVGRRVIDRNGVDPIVLGLYRFGLSGLILAALMAAMGKGRLLGSFAREPLSFLVLGLTGGFGMGFLVFLALQQSNSIPVQVIMNSNAVLIVPLSLLIGERVGAVKVFGLILGVAGCALVLSGVAPEPSGAALPVGKASVVSQQVLGGLLAAGSALCWALYTVIGRGVVRRHGGLTTTTLSMLIGGALFVVPCWLLERNLVLSPQGALAGLWLAIVPTVFGFTAWYIALEELPANVLGPLQFVTPVGGVTMAILWLGEKLTLPMALGGAVALVGVYLSTRERGGQCRMPNAECRINGK